MAYDREIKIGYSKKVSRIEHDINPIGATKIINEISIANPALGNQGTVNMSSSGAYTGSTFSYFEIQIVLSGTSLSSARYQWQKDNGGWSGNISPSDTGGTQTLSNGVDVNWSLIGDQELIEGDRWVILVSPGRVYTTAPTEGGGGNAIFINEVTGDNSNSGRSRALAVKDIATAQTKAIAAGLIILQFTTSGKFKETLSNSINGFLLQSDYGCAPTIWIDYKDQLVLDSASIYDVYVSKLNGSDETGDGTIDNPFASITKAMLPIYKYCIILDGEDYTSEGYITVPSYGGAGNEFIIITSKYYPQVRGFITGGGDSTHPTRFQGISFVGDKEVDKYAIEITGTGKTWLIAYNKFYNYDLCIYLHSITGSVTRGILYNSFTYSNKGIYCENLNVGIWTIGLHSNFFYRMGNTSSALSAGVNTSGSYCFKACVNLTADLSVSEMDNNTIDSGINLNAFQFVTNGAVNHNFFVNGDKNIFRNINTAFHYAAYSPSGSGVYQITGTRNDRYNVITYCSGFTDSETFPITDDPKLISGTPYPKSDSAVWENGTYGNLGVEFDDYKLIKTTGTSFYMNGIILENDFDWGYCIRGKNSDGLYLKNCEIRYGGMGVLNPDNGFGQAAYLDNCIVNGQVVGLNINEGGLQNTLIYNTRSDYAVGAYIGTGHLVTYAEYFTIFGFNIGLMTGTSNTNPYIAAIFDNIYDVFAESPIDIQYSRIAIYNSNVTALNSSIVDPLFNDEENYDFKLRSKAQGYTDESPFLNYSSDTQSYGGYTGLHRDIGAFNIVRVWTYVQWKYFTLTRPLQGYETNLMPTNSFLNKNELGKPRTSATGNNRKIVLRFEAMRKTTVENIEKLYERNSQIEENGKIQFFDNPDTEPNNFKNYMIDQTTGFKYTPHVSKKTWLAVQAVEITMVEYED